MLIEQHREMLSIDASNSCTDSMEYWLQEPTGFTYYEGAVQGLKNRSSLIVMASKQSDPIRCDRSGSECSHHAWHHESSTCVPVATNRPSSHMLTVSERYSCLCLLICMHLSAPPCHLVPCHLVPDCSAQCPCLMSAEILGVEAAQSAALRAALYYNMNNVTQYSGMTASQVVNDFGALRGLLGAGTGQGLTFSYDGVVGANLIAADGQGLAFARNPAQV